MIYASRSRVTTREEGKLITSAVNEDPFESVAVIMGHSEGTLTLAFDDFLDTQLRQGCTRSSGHKNVGYKKPRRLRLAGRGRLDETPEVFFLV